MTYCCQDSKSKGDNLMLSVCIQSHFSLYGCFLPDLWDLHMLPALCDWWGELDGEQKSVTLRSYKSADDAALQEAGR